MLFQYFVYGNFCCVIDSKFGASLWGSEFGPINVVLVGPAIGCGEPRGVLEVHRSFPHLSELHLLPTDGEPPYFGFISTR